MTDQPHWPREEPGAEALFRRGPKGDKGDPGGSMTSGAFRAFLILLVLVLALSAAQIVIGARAYNTLQTRQMTQCQFNRDLGNLASVKVMVNPKTHKASKVGIAILADSRSAFRGLGCRGHLDKPGPSFIHWAKLYKLPAN